MRRVRPVSVLRDAVREFTDDDALTLGAATAFYTALSLAPLLLLLLAGAAALGEGAQDRMVGQIEEVVGPQAGEGVRMIIESADRRPSIGSVAGIVGTLTLLFSATGVFAQLQYSLNRLWNVRPHPDAGWGDWVRKRLLSLGMLLTIGFLLLVSLGISAALSLLLSGEGLAWQAVNLAASLLVFTALFGAIFKVLPDVAVPWSQVWLGGFLTALLFSVGKFAIGLYLGKSSVGSSYGAAGSLIVLLLWVYYSCLILFFGAELTQVLARARGIRLRPNRHAEWDPAAPEARQA